MTIKYERLGGQATMPQAVNRSDVDSTGSRDSAEDEEGEQQHRHNSFTDTDHTDTMSQARRHKACEQCTCQDTRALRRLRTTSTTTCSRRATSPSPTSVIASLTLLLVLQPSAVWARHQAKVHGSQCSYTLVVNEFDVSKCPTMQADAQTSRTYQWSRDSHRPAAAALMSGDAEGPSGRFAGGARGAVDPEGAGQGVDVLKSQVRDLEARLLDEMLRSRELNSTLARHSTALDKAETQLSAYSSNLTAIYRAMMFVQRQLAKQRKVNKSLNKKLSNVLLDVVEVNNVLTRAPSSPGEMVVGGGKLLVGAASKNFEVHSVAKVRSCPGVTDKSTTYSDTIDTQSSEREDEKL